LSEAGSAIPESRYGGGIGIGGVLLIVLSFIR
jgi:hypothetical protein